MSLYDIPYIGGITYSWDSAAIVIVIHMSSHNSVYQFYHFTI